MPLKLSQKICSYRFETKMCFSEFPSYICVNVLLGKWITTCWFQASFTTVFNYFGILSITYTSDRFIGGGGDVRPPPSKIHQKVL